MSEMNPEESLLTSDQQKMLNDRAYYGQKIKEAREIDDKIEKLENNLKNAKSNIGFYGITQNQINSISTELKQLKKEKPKLIKDVETVRLYLEKSSSIKSDISKQESEIEKLDQKIGVNENAVKLGLPGAQEKLDDLKIKRQTLLDKVSNQGESLKTLDLTEETPEEVSEVQPQRGSGGSETPDIGTVTGAPRRSNIPLGDGEINLGTLGAQPLAGPNIQTTDYAEGIFYSNSSTGRTLRSQLTSLLRSFGVEDVSESKLFAYWNDAVKSTAAANQADNPNQSVWDTLKSSLNASNAEKLGSGGGTGPSAQVVKAKKESIELLSTQLGVTLTDNQINDLAYRFANGELDASTINFRIAKIGEIDFAAGEAANTLNELKTKASEFGILYGNDWYNQSARKILTGEIDQDTINQQIRDLAKSQFPTLSAQIDEGYTVKQIASPYIQSMAAILEIDPTTIGLQDLSIKQALTGVDMDGKPNTKPLWMFEQDLRKDPRWNYTKNAQEATMGVARKVLQDFGLAY
jgi:hypothetical protein